MTASRAKKKRPAPDHHAIFTIYNAEHMTAKGRKIIAAWLRHQAGMLVKEGNKYAKRFSARYMRHKVKGEE